MRIALVVPGGFDRSGREHVIPILLSLTERLARRHDVVVYVLRYLPQAESYRLLGATVRDLGRPEGTRRQYRALLNALREDGPFDVIHGHWALPSGLVSAAAGRRLGTPSIVTCDSGEFVAIHDIGYGSQRRWRQRLAVHATLRLASRVVVCSRYQWTLARRFGVSPDIIPLGVDRHVFASRLRSDGPPWRIIHVASLNPVKDHGTLLRAMAALVARGVEAHLDMAGVDTMDGRVAALSRELGLSEHVTFHGFLPTDRLVPLYQHAHIAVQSSRHEAAGAVVLEAGACGIPVVGTAVGHVSDGAPERALAVPTGDAGALAAALESVLTDPVRGRRLADAGRAWALQHDADWSAARFEELYRQLTPAS